MLFLLFWLIAYGSNLTLNLRRKNYGSLLSWGLKAGELLLTPQDAVNLVEEIIQRGSLILGVDL